MGLGELEEVVGPLDNPLKGCWSVDPGLGYNPETGVVEVNFAFWVGKLEPFWR